MSLSRLLLLGFLALFGCGRSPEPQSILLITLDTTRADRLGCYGHDAAQTPTLDALASEGWLFEHATTPYPLTLPAHASMLTGVYPFAHGSRNNGMTPRPDVRSVVESVQQAGYQTAAVISAAVLEDRFGLARGFDLYDDDFAGADPPERTADAATDAALAALARFDERPFFLWVHYFDPHYPYEAPAEFAALDAYDGEIAYVDAQIARLLQGLQERRSETAIVVASDHGEALGEHGERQHGLLIYETTIAVPLILRVPGEAAQRITAPVSLLDVAPTLLDLAGLEESSFEHAVSLLQTARGNGDDDRAITAESILPFYNHGAAPLAAVKRGGWKYIDAPRRELYDLTADPDERSNRFQTLGTHADELRTALTALHPLEWLSGAVPDASDEIDEQTRQMLASLGYVGDTHVVETRADPKDLVLALDLVRQADRHGRRGEDAEAEAAYRRALELLPNNWKATWRLGDFLVQRDRLVEARDLYRGARQADPQNLTVALRLGQVLRGLGQPAAALAELEAMLAAYPEHRAARIERALAWIDLRRHQEARVELQSLLTARDDPGLREILEQLPRP